MITLTWSVSVDAGDFARTAAGQTTVDALDRLTVMVPDASTNLEAQVQPGPASQVAILLIDAQPPHASITYSVNSSAGAAKRFALDHAHFLAGAGAISLLPNDPIKLFFNNASGNGSVIDILVGRKATP